MSVITALNAVAKRLNRRLGIQALLAGAPRPPAGGFDVKGGNLLDWGFVCSGLPPGPKRALEIGCGESPIIPAMLARGYDVTAVDLCPGPSSYLSGFQFILGDFTSLRLQPGFDVVVACSALAHMGLPGRYGSPEDANGDLKAMDAIAGLLSPNGLLFLTIPVGTDAVVNAMHRVYGRGRLPKLLDGFDVVDHRFLVKDPCGPWRESGADAALEHPADKGRHALGQMILSLPFERPYRGRVN